MRHVFIIIIIIIIITPNILFVLKNKEFQRDLSDVYVKHQIQVENFTKQKITSSKQPKTIIINNTNMKLLIVG